MSSRRQYTLKKRADEMAETRRRITEAAVELHGTVGPARTTWSAVAERAGVERHTVYRHFPTEAELFGACSAHYFAAHPFPDLEPWRAIPDPNDRLARALNDIYRFYERTEPMFTNVWRDIEFVDAIRPGLAPFLEYLDKAAQILATGFGGFGERRCLLDAAIGHAIDFHTWRSLAAADCVTRDDAVRLVAALVQKAATA